MMSSRDHGLLLCAAFCLASAGLAQAQQGADAGGAGPGAVVGTAASGSAAAEEMPPIGPPDDPFGDATTRGVVLGGFRVTPAVGLTGIGQSNPQMTTPKGPSDTGTAVDFSARITPVAPSVSSLFLAVGGTRPTDLDSERDKRILGRLLTTKRLAGWDLPMSLMYSQFKLARSSLLSQEGFDSEPLAERQTATTVIASVNAIRTFGLNTFTLGLNLTDTAIDDARLANGTTQASSASNVAQIWSTKMARPIAPQINGFWRTGHEHYTYDAGDQPVIGTRDSRAHVLAVGVEGMRGPIQGMAEIGRHVKHAHSTVVPDSWSTIGGVMGSYAVSPALRLTGRLNQQVMETNLPGVSNVLARAGAVGMDWRFAPKWMAQVELSSTRMMPHPVSGSLTDQVSNLTLLWKPSPKVLMALTAAKTRRSVSEELVSLVNPFSNLKTTLNLTYYP